MGFGTLALLVVAGLAGPLLASVPRLRLPVVIGELAVGIVLGKTGFGVVDHTEPTFELLANVGSTAPYVGLVGTVFGIMVTMHGLLNSTQQAGIKDVAPGISEALLATAMGLFVAIPAVWAYNRYATRVERLAVRYETFAEEFSSILQRQSHADEA